MEKINRPKQVKINLFAWDILDKIQTRLRGRCKRQVVALKNGTKKSKFEPGHSFYDSAIWKKVREVILERDGYKCQECFRRGTHVHHKDKNRHNLDSENLITLCRKCHMKKHPHMIERIPMHNDYTQPVNEFN